MEGKKYPPKPINIQNSTKNIVPAKRLVSKVTASSNPQAIPKVTPSVNITQIIDNFQTFQNELNSFTETDEKYEVKLRIMKRKLEKITEKNSALLNLVKKIHKNKVNIMQRELAKCNTETIQKKIDIQKIKQQMIEIQHEQENTNNNTE